MKEELEKIRSEAHLPSICAGAIVNGKIVALEAVGVRHEGSEEAVTTADRYHCGSNTKSFTAALFALMVQRGKASWDEPIMRLLPKSVVDGMDPAFAVVTPRMLAAHQAGFTGDTYPAGMPNFSYERKNLPEERLKYAAFMLKQPPAAKPGTKYIYSNAGFIILGAILENLTHQTWEDLLTAEILKPLGLKSAGFGSAGPGQPWGHIEKDGKWMPIAPGPFADNLPVLGPAGTLNMSVSDLLKWCAFQADEGRNGGLLTSQTFTELRKPIGEYGGGLIQTDRSWAGGKALTHSGSNTMNFETFWIAPKKGFAVVVATNAMSEKAPEAVDKACALLIRRFCPK